MYNFLKKHNLDNPNQINSNIKCDFSLAIVLYKTSFTSVDFPEPDTPVTQLNTPSGNLTLIFFKLFSVAPCTSITFDFNAFLLFLGTGIFFLPLKYCPSYRIFYLFYPFCSTAVP